MHNDSIGNGGGTMASTGLGTFLREFSKEVEEGNAAIFAGAGLSIPAGFVDWRISCDLAPEFRTGR
jgi:hypothetical protein